MIFTSVQGVHLLANYKETLPKEERKPLVMNDMQPLSFLQLFQTRTLALVRVQYSVSDMQPLLLLPSCLAGLCCSPAVCGGLMDWLGVRLSSFRVIWCGAV